MRRASGTGVPDTTSGFRAYNREAALQMQVVSKFTYTLESIIQAGKMLVAVDHVPIRTNPKTRESRLFPSTGSYVRRNAVSIFRIYALYEPLRVFLAAAAFFALIGAVIWARFLYFYFFSDEPGEHIQSLILGSTLFIVAVQLAALGVVGDILAGSRAAPAARCSSGCGASSCTSAWSRRTTSQARATPARRPRPAPGRAAPPARPRIARR